MTLDWSISDEALATVVTALPDGTDLGAHPLADMLTGRNGAPRNPERYARIFTIASQNARTEWMRIACRIQDYNGTRRMPSSNMMRLSAGLHALAGEIESLPVGPQQWALRGECAYHQGIVACGLRDYAGAARAQRFSGFWFSAAGLHDNGRVAVFIEAVDEVSAALVEGKIIEIQQAFAQLLQIREMVRQTCDPYPRWMQENAAIHVWWAHLMAKMLGVTIEYLGGDDESEVLRTPCEQWRWACHVATARTDEIPASADAALLALSNASSSFIGNVVLTIKLLKAHALLREQRKDDARKLLREIVAWLGPDGGVPIAIAKVMLVQIA
ncbi:hypothetical protein HY625_00715 [Candidatus Uhrbacteria bacterium]|nr:hypothetical protein [Candidatus Uhrbacteria bacterium]